MTISKDYDLSVASISLGDYFLLKRVASTAWLALHPITVLPMIIPVVILTLFAAVEHVATFRAVQQRASFRAGGVGTGATEFHLDEVER